MDFMDLESFDKELNNIKSSDKESNNNLERNESKLNKSEKNIEFQGATASPMRLLSNKHKNEKSIIERLRMDGRFQKIEDKTKKELEDHMKNILLIPDTDRIADLNNEEDLIALSKSKNIFHKIDVHNEQKIYNSDSYNYVLSLEPNAVFDHIVYSQIQEHKILPILKCVQADYFKDSLNSTDDIIMWMPLINLPVFTSKFLLLLSGEKLYMISDSFFVIRYYITMIKMLLHVDFTRSRKRTAILWLKNRFQNRIITRKDLEDFSSFSVICEDKKQLFSCSDLIIKFDERILQVEDFERLHEYIEDVHLYKSGWSKDRIFREDIVKEHSKDKEEIVEELCSKIEKLNSENVNNTFYDELMQIIYCISFKLIHSYEIIIMRLYHEGCLFPCFPKEYRMNLLTKVEMPDNSKIDSQFREIISKSRNEIMYLRNKYIINLEVSEQLLNNEYENNYISALPSVSELEQYLLFLKYDAKTEEDLRLIVTQLKKVIETKNSKNLIKKE